MGVYEKLQVCRYEGAFYIYVLLNNFIYKNFAITCVIFYNIFSFVLSLIKCSWYSLNSICKSSFL